MHFLQLLEPWGGLSVVSLSFVYLFLPVSLLLYYLVPPAKRQWTLVGLSLLFLLLAHPKGLPLLLAVLLFNYAALRLLSRWREQPFRRRVCMWTAVVLDLAILLLVFSLVQIQTIPLQLGVLVVTLSGLDAVLERYRDRESPPPPLGRFALYILFFPRLYAGPLLPYGDFARQLEQPVKTDAKCLARGASCFLAGAFKTLVIGGQLSEICREIQSFGSEEVSVLSTWCLVLTFGFAVYFNFSGFCDMARGLGKLFGLDLPLNFYYPYQAQGIADFFDRFNSTVIKLLRRTIYRELGEDRHGKASDCVNLLICGMLIGLWFGLRINYLLWGIYLSVFVLLERYAYPGILRETPMLLRRVYSLCVVLSSFTILSADSPLQSLRHIQHMFRLSREYIPLYNYRILYLVSSNWLVLLLACFLATSIASMAGRALAKALPRATPYANAGFSLLVLILFTTLSL